MQKTKQNGDETRRTGNGSGNGEQEEFTVQDRRHTAGGGAPNPD